MVAKKKYLFVYGYEKDGVIHTKLVPVKSLKGAKKITKLFSFSQIFESTEDINSSTVEFIEDYFFKKWNQEEPEKEMTYIFMDYKRKEYQFVAELNSLLYLLVNYELLIKGEGYYYGSENEEYRLIFNVNRSKGEKMCREEGLKEINYVIL